MAKLLSREKQDIILIDDNEERMSTLSSNFDLMTVNASPTSIKGLKEVGAGEADLFIAVTPDESRNITACMLATNLGAVKTSGVDVSMDYKFPNTPYGQFGLGLPATGEQVLTLMGKELTAKGIITVAQIPAAIAALNKAVEDSEASGHAEESDSARGSHQGSPFLLY